MNNQMNGKREAFANAETQMTASVPVPTTADFSSVPPTTIFSLLNYMLDQKLGSAIIRKQKVQYSITHFKDYNTEWMLCEVENLSGAGDDLVLLVQKTTPITIYATGAVKSPFN